MISVVQIGLAITDTADACIFMRPVQDDTDIGAHAYAVECCASLAPPTWQCLVMGGLFSHPNSLAAVARAFEFFFS